MAVRASSTASAALRTLQNGTDRVPIPFPPIPNLRVWLEARTEQLLGEAERLIAMLDTLDGDTDLEPDADAEPSLAGFGLDPSGGDDRELDDADDEAGGDDEPDTDAERETWGEPVYACSPIRFEVRP